MAVHGADTGNTETVSIGCKHRMRTRSSKRWVWVQHVRDHSDRFLNLDEKRRIKTTLDHINNPLILLYITSV